jgi:hypothetical protein
MRRRILIGVLAPSMRSEFDGKWFHAMPEGDAAMQRLLKRIGAARAVSLSLPITGGASGRLEW